MPLLSLIVPEEIHTVMARVDEKQVEAMIKAIHESEAVFVTGAGRSLLMMKAFAMRLVHLGMTVHVVGETTTPAIAPGNLLIAGSGSGQTRTTEAIVQAAKERNARIGVLTAHLESPIASLADLVVEIPTPLTVSPETVRESLQPPGSLFEQCLLVLGDTIILMLKERLGATEEMMRARHTKLE